MPNTSGIVVAFIMVRWAPGGKLPLSRVYATCTSKRCHHDAHMAHSDTIALNCSAVNVT